MKHTQGQWKRNTAAEKTTFVVGNDRTPIFTVIHHEGTVKEMDYNDCLIAAAPELLEALEDLRNVVMLSNDRVIWDNGKNAETVAKAWEVIRKAKGGQL